MIRFFKISFAVMAACLTIGSLSSFTANSANFYWHYNGDDDPANFNTPGLWSVDSSPETCSSGDRPCQIPTETDNPSELQAILTMNPGTALYSVAGQKP